MPVAVGTERKQLFAYDRVIKTRGWQSLLIVNPKGDAEANGLLAFCRQLRITVVWDPEASFSPVPTERMRRDAVLARMQVTSRANPRLRIMLGAPLLVAGQLARQQHEEALPLFSGAILTRLEQDQPVAPQLRCWAALCAPDGMLIGKQHADLKLRAELTQVSPLWRPWPNGLWLLDVKHVVPAVVSRETSAPPEPPTAVDKNPDDFWAAGAGAENPVTKSEDALNLARTRPVWETLEQNLRP